MARKGLGRGIESLMGEANAEVGPAKADATLPISKIEPNPDQPRKEFDAEKLQELADSIKQHGVLQPILVRKTGSTYQIVAGERRYQASKLAGLKEIPAVIRDISDEDVFQLALIENLQRADLNPVEEAQGLRQLVDQKGWTQEKVAQVLSKSRSAVANTLRLLDLPEEVQGYLARGEITPGHARAILAVPDEEGRIALAERVVKENLTVRQTENLASLISVSKEHKAPKPPTPQSYKQAARELREILDTKVRVKDSRGGKHKIEIEFGDEDDLARIIEAFQRAAGSEMGE